MSNNEEILKIAGQIADKAPDLLGDDLEKLELWLKKIPKDDPEAIRQTVNRILDLLTGHPEALEYLLRETRGNAESFGPVTKGVSYSGPPDGDMNAVSAGTRMVCPKPGCGQNRTLRQKGQRLFCPTHEIPLVPEERLS